jgi:glutamate racemase
MLHSCDLCLGVLRFVLTYGKIRIDFSYEEDGLRMDTRPIGVFDSGIGGLTTVKKLIEYLPGEDIIYLGDTGRVPYGSKSKETIVKYAFQDARFLTSHDIKAMVIACNSASSSAFDDLNRSFDMPVYEVISAAVRVAAKSTKNGKIGVIGTKATINSGAYHAALKEAAPETQVFTKACPLFVPLVEEGFVERNDIAALSAADRYLSEMRDAGVDTLILGCTHYPLLSEVILKVIGDGVTLIDSGAETAKHVAHDLDKRGVLSDNKSEGVIKYFVTDSVESFVEPASRFLKSNIRGLVKQINLDHF